jgi:hypothetical protein
VARGELEPFRGLPTGTICGVASAGSCPTLFCGDLFASSSQSQSVLFSELCAHAERVGCFSQGRR